MKRQIGALEAQVLAYAQMRQWQTLRTGNLQKPLRLSDEQERKVLSRLARSGLIARVWRGLYLVPPALPVGGRWSPEVGLALGTLMEARGGRYQICGPNAFNRYGFDEQIPTRTYAYNDQLSGERRIGRLEFTLIKVAPSRLGATDLEKSGDGPPAIYCSRARSLVDAVYDWSRFGSLPAGYRWIRRELAAERVSVGELVRLTLEFGDRGTIRRTGAFLDREGAPARSLRPLEKALPSTTGSIPLIPRLPKRGTIDRRWGVVWNGEV